MTTAAASLRRIAPDATVPLFAGVAAAGLACGLLAARSPFLALALVTMLVLAIAMIADSQVATIVAIFLIYFDAPGVIVQAHGAPSIAGAAFPLLLVLPFLVGVLRGERVIFTPTLAFALLLFAAMVAATVLSAYPDEAMKKVESFIIEGLLLYFLITNVVRTPAGLRRALWAIVVAGAALAFISVFQSVTHSYFRPFFGFGLPDPAFNAGQSTDWRASGPFGDPNYYGQLLVVAMAISLVFTFRERTAALRTVAGGATAVMLYAMALSYSRGAGLALAVLFVIMAFLRYFTAGQLLAMVLGVAVLLVAVPSYLDRVATVTSVSSANAEAGSSDPNADLSTQQRATEMRAAYAVFKDHYVIGVGPAVFPEYYRRYAQKIGGAIHQRERSGAKKGEEAKREAHNIFLDTAASVGIIGLVAFLGVLATSLAAILRTRRACLLDDDGEGADLATAVFLAIVAYVLTGMFLSLAYDRYFWLIVGLAGAASSVALVRPGPPRPQARRARITRREA